MKCFVRYCISRLRREAEERSFKVYVTESIRLQGEGKHISSKWLDIVQPKKSADIGNVDEFIKSFLDRAEIEVVA